MSAHVPFDVIGVLDPLRRYARALTRNESQAEDLVQNALVRAYERQETFRPEASLKTWLFSILHNLFIDECRRQKTERQHTAAFVEIDLSQQGLSQETHVRLRQIENLFNQLPDDQRAVLYLVAVEGYAYEDAARALSIPVGTLMSRLGRARAALRAQEEGRNGSPLPLRAVRKQGEA